MAHPQFVDRSDPEDVFELVSDDIRVDILRSLWESDEPMSFSDLHDSVDVRDSGQFNYHLDKLLDRFVAKTDDRYELTAAGKRINGAIDAGSYTSSGSMEPLLLDEPCTSCGDDRIFYYEDDRVRVECESCAVQAGFAVPPSTFVGCDREAIPEVAGRYLTALIRRIDTGFCSKCDGPVERTVRRAIDTRQWDDESDIPEDGADPRNTPVVEYECRNCGSGATAGLTVTLLSHPTVVSFYHERGVDVRELSVWNWVDLEQERVLDRDPFRASGTFRADGDELTVVVDENRTVVETTVTERR